MWVEYTKNIEKAIINDFELSNTMQIGLIIDYYSDKSQNIINTPDNNEVVFWVQNYSKQFREIWDYWIRDVQKIKQMLYQD